MNFSSKSLTAAVLIISCIALGYFAVYPQWTKYSAAKTDLNAAYAQQDSLKLAQKQLNTFLSDYKQHSADAARVNQSLPLSSSQMHNILNNLDQLTKSSGLTLGALNFDETPGGDSLGAAPHSIRPINLSISGSGPYPALKNFLVSLESNLRLMDITSVTLGATDTSVIFNLKFVTYYQQ